MHVNVKGCNVQNMRFVDLRVISIVQGRMGLTRTSPQDTWLRNGGVVPRLENKNIKLNCLSQEDPIRVVIL